MSRIIIRADEPEHDAETVLIHMGAGAEQAVTTNAVANYHHYRGLNPDHPARGLLCVSIFGLVAGVTRADIFAALPQGQFGEATWEQVRAVFPILATTISDPNMPAPIAALQRAHFDIQLEHPQLSALDTTDPIGLSDDEADQLDAFVTQQVKLRLLPLFVPRGPKYPKE